MSQGGHARLRSPLHVPGRPMGRPALHVPTYLPTGWWRCLSIAPLPGGMRGVAARDRASQGVLGMSARTRVHVCAYQHMATVHVRCACMCTHTSPPCPIACSNISLYTHEGPLPRCGKARARMLHVNKPSILRNTTPPLIRPLPTCTSRSHRDRLSTPPTPRTQEPMYTTRKFEW